MVVGRWHAQVRVVDAHRREMDVLAAAGGAALANCRARRRLRQCPRLIMDAHLRVVDAPLRVKNAPMRVEC